MVICLNTQKYVWLPRGGKISVHWFGGGAKTWHAIIEGWYVLSASERASAPCLNNDHSLRKHGNQLAKCNGNDTKGAA